METAILTLEEMVAMTADLSVDDLFDVYGAVNDSLAHLPPVFTAAEFAEFDRRAAEPEENDIPGDEVQRWARDWRTWVR